MQFEPQSVCQGVSEQSDVIAGNVEPAAAAGAQKYPVRHRVLPEKIRRPKKVVKSRMRGHSFKALPLFRVYSLAL